MDVEGCWRDIAGGRNEKQVKKAGGEIKKADVSGEEVTWKFMRDVSEAVDKWSWLRAGFFGKSMDGRFFLCEHGFFRAMIEKEEM